jgi:hypothetical protein
VLLADKEQTVIAVRRKYDALREELDERQRRLWAGAEASEIGRRGISWVAEATGLSRTTIRAGVKELSANHSRMTSGGPRRVRSAGGGRKPLTHDDPGLPKALNELIEPTTRGDPESPLRWTCKSTRKLATELTAQDHPVSHETVAQILKAQKYSLQANRKTKEGNQHPDRNAQFEYINRQVKSAQRRKQPSVSVDGKKKENIGPFKNAGREWRPKGQPEKVKVHDFIDKELGKVTPYGVYDILTNEGWVSVGIDHDTAEFAVNSIRSWWKMMGKKAYPNATELTITDEAGGSNSYRTRLWKVALQELADQTDLRLKVCHFPPGTSKWNKIEHRMFCYISKNWRGRPLLTRQTVVELIGNTTTESGLQIRAQLDTNKYPTGVEVTDEELAAVAIKRARFHGDWNYTIHPRK